MITPARKLVACVAAASPTLAFGVGFAHATPATHSGTMHWYRGQTSARALQNHVPASDSLTVLGLASTRDLESLRTRYGFTVVLRLPQLRAAVVRASRPLVVHAASEPRIRYLSRAGSPHVLLSVPNDPLLTTIDPTTGQPYEWQFAAANVKRALEMSPGSRSIVVGTIDSGAAEIPDLAGKVDSRWTVSRTGKVTRDKRGNDTAGHGTAVASLIAANVGDGFGMAGFGGATHVIAIRARALTPIEVAAALMKLDALGARIVNMSFGSPAAEPPIVLDAIHKAASDGLLLVAAAGNSYGAVAHPAADLQGDGLAVGASDADGKLAFFSNFGANLSLLAPGVYRGPCSGVLVAAPVSEEFVSACYPSWVGDGAASYAYVAGTSFAAPEVAGVAALIWAARPQLKNYQVADILMQSARREDAGWSWTTGCGVLDAGAALELTLARSGAEWASDDAAPSSCQA